MQNETSGTLWFDEGCFDAARLSTVAPVLNRRGLPDGGRETSAAPARERQSVTAALSSARLARPDRPSEPTMEDVVRSIRALIAEHRDRPSVRT